MFDGDLQTVGYVIGGLITLINSGILFWKKKASKDDWNKKFKKIIEPARLVIGTAVTIFAAQIFIDIEPTTIALITPAIVGGSWIVHRGTKVIKNQLKKESNKL